MPIGEIEIHPYLRFGEAIPNATRLILGSFPVYCCTYNDSPFKAQKRAEKHLAQFFYGSHRSQFWKLFKDHVDPTLPLPVSKDEAIVSLSAKRIAMSDTIMTAERRKYSASDNDLRNQNWNTQGLTWLFNQGVIKVLCTSKGVLRDLGKKIICFAGNPIGEYSVAEGQALQSEFITSIGGDTDAILEPIASVFTLYNSSTISAICIPSPGSAQRSIQHFGHTYGSKTDYANLYFRQAFDWLLTD